MIKKFLNSFWPHIAIAVAFAVVSFLYFTPILEGKVLPQGDNTQAIGSARELSEFAQETGDASMWTNSMFSGMPAYQIKADNTSNVFENLNKITRLGLPYGTVSILFLYLLGFYVLLLALKTDKLVAAIGALAFALGSYNIIIIIAGHITKAYAIAIMPIVVAGVLTIFRGNRIAGGILTTVAFGMELAYNHIQITYYLGLMLMVLIIAEVIMTIKSKAYKEFGKSVGTMAAAIVLAILPGTVNLWTTYEYSEFSTRGKSELKAPETNTEQKTSSGLDKDYALAWSYGKKETPTLLIPNVVGGASEAIGADNKYVQKISDPQIRNVVAQQSSYWGDRSFTSGPVYVGDIVCFLFVLGCFYCKGREKWWLIAATIFSILLAWGKNFMPFTDFMFYHFPMYNKFRTVEMALVIATVSIPMLGFLGLKELIEAPELIKAYPKKFFGALGISAGIALLIALFPTAFYSFISDAEQEQFAQLIAGQNGAIYSELRNALIETRASITQSDAIRTIVFIVLASSALWFLSVRKISERIALATIAILIGMDMWSVDRRYLSSDDFVSKHDAKNTFVASAADKAIMQDKEPHRVTSLYRNPWNEAYTSYFHQSIGGYHGAKLHRYQDLIDYELGQEWMAVRSALSAQDVDGIAKQLEHSNAINMLNTKYFIYNPSAAPITNPNAMGAAWFVDDVIYAPTPDDALKNVSTADLRRVAVVENNALRSTPDSTATIVRTSYAPNKLTYHTTSSSDRLAVFSEIYYPKGWKATIDGNEVPIERANYVLRAITIPQGEHDIEMRFEPQSYTTGRIIAYIASAIVILLIIGGIAYYIKGYKNETAE
ncbi:MAG: YfhO family protein [Bacteroidales bacterium]|nr:YfhO family protein [Bacteroidales bacterium]